MRLTNVSQMRLQPGRLFSYGVEVDPNAPQQQLPVSSDQDRHVSAGSRTGSWMAVAFLATQDLDHDQIAHAWHQVIQRHQNLRCVFRRRTDDDVATEQPTSTAPADTDPEPATSGGPDTDLILTEVGISMGSWQELSPGLGACEDSPGAELNATQLRTALRAHFDTFCESFAAPAYRLCVIEPSPAPTPAPEQMTGSSGTVSSGGSRTRQLVIGIDHSLVDAWSLLVLVRDVGACLDSIVAQNLELPGLPAGSELAGSTPAAPEVVTQAPSVDPGVSESTPGVPATSAPTTPASSTSAPTTWGPVESFSSHTATLEAKPFPPEEIQSRWSEILAAGGGAMPRFPLDLGDLSTPVPEVVEVRDVLDVGELQWLESHAAHHGARLIAVAVAVMTQLSLELAQEPLRVVFPVHSRYDERWFNSVGWFITNSVLENTDTSYRGCHSAVKEAIKLGSYPLAPIMRPYGGMPQEPGMFAMSWLDHRKLPVHVSPEVDPQHVSAVIHTDGVMIWFVINNAGLHLRCRYPDTRQARRAMRTWLAGLVYGLRGPLERNPEAVP